MMGERRREARFRLGPVSILTLVVCLCLFVMGVLALSTAHAQLTLAKRQAALVTEGYANEQCGQVLLASVNDTAEEARQLGQNGYQVASLVQDDLDELQAGLQDRLSEDAVVELSVENMQVIAHFESEDGRCLDVVLKIREDATVDVASWKATTLWSDESDDVLWTGNN